MFEILLLELLLLKKWLHFHLKMMVMSFFITQEDSGYQNESAVGSILGDKNDFQSPCCSVFDSVITQYLDISDNDDAYQIPSSQMNTHQNENKKR